MFITVEAIESLCSVWSSINLKQKQSIFRKLGKLQEKNLESGNPITYKDLKEICENL